MSDNESDAFDESAQDMLDIYDSGVEWSDNSDDEYDEESKEKRNVLRELDQLHNGFFDPDTDISDDEEACDDEKDVVFDDKTYGPFKFIQNASVVPEIVLNPGHTFMYEDSKQEADMIIENLKALGINTSSEQRNLEFSLATHFLELYFKQVARYSGVNEADLWTLLIVFCVETTYQTIGSQILDPSDANASSYANMYRALTPREFKKLLQKINVIPGNKRTRTGAQRRSGVWSHDTGVKTLMDIERLFAQMFNCCFIAGKTKFTIDDDKWRKACKALIAFIGKAVFCRNGQKYPVRHAAVSLNFGIILSFLTDRDGTHSCNITSCSQVYLIHIFLIRFVVVDLHNCCLLFTPMDIIFTYSHSLKLDIQFVAPIYLIK